MRFVSMMRAAARVPYWLLFQSHPQPLEFFTAPNRFLFFDSTPLYCPSEIEISATNMLDFKSKTRSCFTAAINESKNPKFLAINHNAISFDKEVNFSIHCLIT
jgi:hypothetical protein